MLCNSNDDDNNNNNINNNDNNNSILSVENNCNICRHLTSLKIEYGQQLLINLLGTKEGENSLSVSYQVSLEKLIVTFVFVSFTE